MGQIDSGSQRKQQEEFQFEWGGGGGAPSRHLRTSSGRKHTYYSVLFSPMMMMLMMTWWMKLGGNRPPGDNPLLFPISGAGSFIICPVTFGAFEYSSASGTRTDNGSVPRDTALTHWASYPRNNERQRVQPGTTGPQHVQSSANQAHPRGGFLFELDSCVSGAFSMRQDSLDPGALSDYIAAIFTLDYHNYYVIWTVP